MVGIIGSPVVGTSLSLLLKLAATPFIAKIVHNMLWALKLGIRIAAPVITKEKTWPDMINDDLSKTTLDSFLYSIKSLHETDLREGVMGLEIPVLGIYGRKDVLVNPDQREILTDTVKLSQIAYFQDAGHFPMLDIPDKFMHTLKRFLDGETIVLVD